MSPRRPRPLTLRPNNYPIKLPEITFGKYTVSLPGHYADVDRGPSGGQNWCAQSGGRDDHGRGPTGNNKDGIKATGLDESQSDMNDSQRDAAKLLARQMRSLRWGVLSSRHPEAGETTSQPMANRVTETMADADRLDVRSREGEHELLMQSHSELGTKVDRVRVSLPCQRAASEECSAIQNTPKQRAGRVRINFRKLEKANGSYHAKFDLIQSGSKSGDKLHQEPPRPGFAIIVRVSEEEGPLLDIQLTGTVIVGELHSDAWFNAVIFSPPSAEALMSRSTLFGTVELPDDNAAGGRQNVAIFEVESGRHEVLAEQLETTPDRPPNTISAAQAFEPVSQSVTENGETVSTSPTFHEEFMKTAANTTPKPRPHPTIPGSITALEEAMAKSRRLPVPAPAPAPPAPAPAPKPWNAFDEGEKFLAAHKAAARRQTERRPREYFW
jgi:hypothetical protein